MRGKRDGKHIDLIRLFSLVRFIFEKSANTGSSSHTHGMI